MHLKKLYIIILILLLSSGFAYAQVFPHELGKDFSLLFPNPQKKDSVKVYFLNEKGQKLDSLKTNSQEVLQKVHKYHTKRLNEGRIYNRLNLIRISNTQNDYIYFFKISQNKLKRIDTLIYVSRQKKFPLNLKKFLAKNYIQSPLSRKNLLQLSKTIQKLVPEIRVKNIRPIIYKEYTGASINYETHFQNFFEGEINTLFQKNKTVLKGFLNLDLKNLLNQAENLRLFWRKEEKSQEINLHGLFPYIAGTSFFATGNYHIRQSSSTIQWNEHQIMTGWMQPKYKVGFSYYYLKKEKKESTKQMGGYFSYSFSKNPLYEFNLDEKLSIEIRQNLEKEKNMFFQTTISYSSPLLQNYYLYMGGYLMKNTNPIFSTPLNEENHLLLNNIFSQTTFVNLYYLNLRLLAKYKKSLFYFTSTYTHAKNIQIYDQYEIGTGIISLSKNQMINIEFVYAIYKASLKDLKGFKIKIYQKIKI